MKRPYVAPAVVRSWWIYRAPLELLARFHIFVTSIRTEPGTWSRAVFGEERNTKGWKKP